MKKNIKYTNTKTTNFFQLKHVRKRNETLYIVENDVTRTQKNRYTDDPETNPKLFRDVSVFLFHTFGESSWGEGAKDPRQHNVSDPTSVPAKWRLNP